ncbi:hypothetical protein [Nocardioides sp. SR21]|uniref:hypothetical protein n=1 Tax=Nocardioides sp. SR21 TaxID=2919501 RepID=UPI001FAB1606|nr:hypothetical protein [Nocardioides sp. SR21]
MTTYSTNLQPARTDLPGTTTTAQRQSRTWTLAGIGAGIAGLGTVVTSGMVNAVYDPDLAGDSPAIAEKLADQTGPMFAFHTFTAVGAVLMILFAAGLFRRLRARSAADSTVPLVAFAGLLGTAVVSILGSGLDTEFIMGFVSDQEIDPSNAVMFNHWIGTIPWLWTLAGLSGLAVFAAGRAGGVPRWIGIVGLVLGGLTLLLGVSPLQYMAGMTGPLWLLVTAAGFCLGDRAHRS